MTQPVSPGTVPPDGAAAPLLEMSGITKRFGATLALDDVSLRVEPGSALALIGENGAGKSTLMKVLSGALQPDSGRMWLGDMPYAPGDCRAARRAGGKVRSIHSSVAMGWTPSTVAITPGVTPLSMARK